MNFHEYQAKELFVQFGIPVPQGTIASTPDAAVEVARQIGGDQWVVKAQIHAGGRGKAGGVKVVKTLTQVRDSAAKMLGTRMETYQSGGRALPVNVVLITEATEISKELYLSMLVDRASRAVTFIASPMGGVDIEQVANDHPEKIFTVEVNFMQSLQAFECRKLGFSMGLGAKQTAQLAKIMMAMFNLFNQCDMSLIELNPLVINSAGDLVALDGKLNCDDNALFRQARLEAMRDVSQDDPLEAQAAKHDLNYVSLDGNIACMVNGAGLAMATMDVIKLYG
ncbi:MAG: ADP-forming succinate--CoA ligase subunit beta, partial [Xanthomonadales bacterium]|nr:ADP-forming succinate--CoA ligase subunit beta [Xanthomonadales bacterium]